MSETQSPPRRRNPYLEGDLLQLFLKTAGPITAVMMVQGMLNVVDAIFLGHFVGADALSAVTMVFPMFMMLVALSSLVGSGTASMMSRALGAHDLERANRVFGSAQRLSLTISVTLLVLYLIVGGPILNLLAGGDEGLIAMGRSYITPIFVAAPMTFLMGLHSDVLRAEGRVPLMTSLSVVITLLNVAFNFVLIALLGLGVLGSALGTIAAQAVAFVLLVGLRMKPSADIHALPAAPFPDWPHWREMLALGLPSSLNFLGVSIMSMVVIYSIHVFSTESYETAIAAYGIAQRIMTFAFFPILGLSMASQAIIGNNFGAKAYHRSNRGLLVALALGLSFGVCAEIVFITMAEPLGRMFVSDPTVIAEVERILPIMVMLFFVFTMNNLLAGYHQAIGDAPRAALFSLSQIYLFTIPTTLILPRFVGEIGIWAATPVAQSLMTCLVAVTLFLTWKKTGRRFGLLIPEEPQAE